MVLLWGEPFQMFCNFAGIVYLTSHRSHWLESNVNRLALTFGRPVLGVHNKTSVHPLSEPNNHLAELSQKRHPIRRD